MAHVKHLLFENLLTQWLRYALHFRIPVLLCLSTVIAFSFWYHFFLIQWLASSSILLMIDTSLVVPWMKRFVSGVFQNAKLLTGSIYMKWLLLPAIPQMERFEFDQFPSFWILVNRLSNLSHAHPNTLVPCLRARWLAPTRAVAICMIHLVHRLAF